MCNLYSLIKGQAAILERFRAPHDRTGNRPLFPAIFPDQMAPIIRVGAEGERELVMARWECPALRSSAARRRSWGMPRASLGCP
jgi:putative SOS response-associated peptidase YedK